jgi:predicted unusual protein kinase regulating ubiquinone biosynthesis (AarF/ABC1/UbiB family)
MIPLHTRHFKRYRDIARLMIKYGQSDLVRRSGLAKAVADETPETNGLAGAEALELARDLEKLGPTYVKLGQVLSTRPEFLPAAHREALSRLQDRVEPFSLEEVERILTTELGMLVSHAYVEFDPLPVAAASLSQVHRAKVRDGRTVAVKVQRPGVREQIVDDLDALEDLATFLDHHTETGRRYEFHRLLDMLRRSLMQELDFRNEAQNLHTIIHNLACFENMIVPRPIDELSTSRVLTMDFVEGTKIIDVPEKTLSTFDRRALADELFEAYLHQVLLDGVFHADPHPGNVLLGPSGKVILLDMGLVVRVPPRLQEHLVKMLFTMSEGRGEQAAEEALRMGWARRDFDRGEFHRRVTQLVTETREAPLERMQMGSVVLEMQKIAGETGVRLPDEFAMLGKTLLNLDKTLIALRPDFDLNQAVRRKATKIMRHRSRQPLSLGQAYQTFLETTELIGALPERLNRILKLIADNELRVNVDAVDERALISGIQKVANRITAGLVLAALIVGAALMIQVDKPLTFWLSIFFFLTAGLGALILAFRTLFTDQ